MFSGFNRMLPRISIFHHASSPPSVKALGLLRSSIEGPYPPGKPHAPALEFDLDVVESPPNADQLQTIQSYSNSNAPASSLFLSAHPSSSEHPTTLSGIVELANRNPKAFKWPVVVDWDAGKAAVGDVEGVKGIIEHLRKLRDGEVKKPAPDEPKGWFS